MKLILLLSMAVLTGCAINIGSCPTGKYSNFTHDDLVLEMQKDDVYQKHQMRVLDSLKENKDVIRGSILHEDIDPGFFQMSPYIGDTLIVDSMGTINCLNQATSHKPK